jgi:endonuclease-3
MKKTSPKKKAPLGRNGNDVRRQRAAEILARLKQEYPEPRCALIHRNAYELMVATILSAQSTDVRVNIVTPDLFKRFPDPGSMAKADANELKRLVHSTGFFNNKTKSLLGATNRIVETYKGKVPDTMEDLLTLPGIARKTANVILGTWFGKNEGVVVDTHVHRLSRRLGLTKHNDPVKIEQDLMALFPQEEWTNLSHRLIQHGRQICAARAPRCAVCILGPDVCPSYQPDPKKWKDRKKKTKSSAARGGGIRGARKSRSETGIPRPRKRGSLRRSGR